MCWKSTKQHLWLCGAGYSAVDIEQEAIELRKRLETEIIDEAIKKNEFEVYDKEN